MVTLSRQPSGRFSAFTLVELLVVIGIIALLVSILLPALNTARAMGQSVSCKSQLRQFAIANEMYINDSKGWCVDVNFMWEYKRGLVRYLSNKAVIGENVARCPGDKSTEDMGRLGQMGQSSNSGWWIYPADSDDPANRIVLKVSYGANENSTSASRQVAGGASVTGISERWIKRATLLKKPPLQVNAPNGKPLEPDSTRIMTFGDYQYNRGEASIDPAKTGLAGYQSATIGTGKMPPNGALNDQMGSVVFRHRGRMNAAFLDGHVSEIRIDRKTIGNGHDLAPGQNWGTVPASLGLPAMTTSYGSYASHKVFYPFGPATSGQYIGVYDTMPGWDF